MKVTNRFESALLVGITQDDFTPEGWRQLLQRVSSMDLKEDFAGDLSGVDCLLIRMGVPVDAALLGRMPRLTYIGILSTSFHFVDVEEARRRGIRVRPTASYSTEAVAEFTLAALLEHLRGLARARLDGRAGRFGAADFAGAELRSKTVGVIGLGDIGGRVAQLAAGFGAQVRYWSRTRKPERESPQIRYAELDTVLAESDIVSLNVAIAPQTRGLMSAERIQRLRPGAIFISTVPPEAIDMGALVARLEQQDLTFITIHGPGLAPHMNRLQRLPNAVLYPPLAYRTREAFIAREAAFLHNLEQALTAPSGPAP